MQGVRKGVEGPRIRHGTCGRGKSLSVVWRHCVILPRRRCAAACCLLRRDGRSCKWRCRHGMLLLLLRRKHCRPRPRRQRRRGRRLLPRRRHAWRQRRRRGGAHPWRRPRRRRGCCRCRLRRGHLWRQLLQSDSLRAAPPPAAALQEAAAPAARHIHGRRACCCRRACCRRRGGAGCRPQAGHRPCAAAGAVHLQRPQRLCGCQRHLGHACGAARGGQEGGVRRSCVGACGPFQN